MRVEPVLFRLLKSKLALRFALLQPDHPGMREIRFDCIGCIKVPV